MDLRGNSVDNGVSNLASGARDENALGLIVQGAGCHGAGSNLGDAGHFAE